MIIHKQYDDLGYEICPVYKKISDWSDDDFVDEMWHWVVEDRFSMGFKGCAGIIKMNYEINVTAKQVENKFKQYFIKEFGIAPYEKCPECGEELLPRVSTHFRTMGKIFVGCSGFPDCRFKATDKKKYKKENI